MNATTLGKRPAAKNAGNATASGTLYHAEGEVTEQDASDPFGDAGLSLPTHLRKLYKKLPIQFLDALRQHWKVHRDECASSQSLVKYLRALPVPCKGGGSFPLAQTYLPLPTIERQHACFAVRASFPILALPAKLDEGSWRTDWGFLADSLGVRAFDDVDFYLRFLQLWKDTYNPAYVVGNTSIPRLYAKLLGRCNESMNKEATKAKIR